MYQPVMEAIKGWGPPPFTPIRMIRRGMETLGHDGHLQDHADRLFFRWANASSPA